MQTNNKASAVFHGKCPRCRKGAMFPYSPYNLAKFHKMNADCPECGLHFEREPGFFFGAMYISYAFSVAIFVTVGVALTVLGDYPLYVYLAGIVGSVIVLLPLSFRYSRILFLHVFGGVKFDTRYGN